nr:ATPase, F1/V1/A1 complex, alpha/beta subunit, zinc knuckle CX2CX4HX4C [Tanacetum cinerariifolium]
MNRISDLILGDQHKDQHPTMGRPTKIELWNVISKPNREWGGRRVKEKDLNRNMKNTSSGIGVSTNSEDTMNDDTLPGVASAVQEGVAPCVIDMAVEMGKQNSLDDTTVPKSFPPLSTSLTTTAGNAPGKSSYANITSKPSGKKVNVRTLFTPGGNGIDVVFPVDSIRAISKCFANTAYSFFVGKKVAYPVVANHVVDAYIPYRRSKAGKRFGFVRFIKVLDVDRLANNLCTVWVGRHKLQANIHRFQREPLKRHSSLHNIDGVKRGNLRDTYNSNEVKCAANSYAHVVKGSQNSKMDSDSSPVYFSMDGLDAMLENGPWFVQNNPLILKKWHPDENLLKEDVSTVPIWVKLHGVPVTAFSEDGLSVIATKLDNIVVAMPKITREGHYTCNVRVEYEWKHPMCSSCKVFGHVHEECTKNTGAGKKKTVKKPSQTPRGVPNCMEPTIEVSNSNPFDVLNSVDNDGSFDTNGGTNNLVNNEAISSGSSFMYIDNDGECASNTSIGVKIDKIERQIGEGKIRLLDNDGNPLVPTGIVKSDSEVELVFDDDADLRIPTNGNDGNDKGYGTNSLLEQWKDSYLDNDDYHPYDDDMYENHDLSEHLQSICDDLDITVRGRKKK